MDMSRRARIDLEIILQKSTEMIDKMDSIIFPLAC